MKRNNADPGYGDCVGIMNNYLQMLRAQAGVSQAELADIIGIARTTYSAVENGTRRLTLPIFIALAEYFLKNEKTKGVMELLGLTESKLEPFFQVGSAIGTTKRRRTRKAAAFGGGLDAEGDAEKQRGIEKALEDLDK